jgi:hypothetical protein
VHGVDLRTALTVPPRQPTPLFCNRRPQGTCRRNTSILGSFLVGVTPFLTPFKSFQVCASWGTPAWGRSLGRVGAVVIGPQVSFYLNVGVSSRAEHSCVRVQTFVVVTHSTTGRRGEYRRQSRQSWVNPRQPRVSEASAVTPRGLVASGWSPVRAEVPSRVSEEMGPQTNRS